MKHNLTPAYLDEAIADQIAELSPAELDNLREQLAEDLGLLQRRSGRLETGVALRYGERARVALAPKGQVGTIHLDDGEYDVTVTAAKTVEWDEDKLTAILDAMASDIANHLVKVKVAIDERKFLAALPDIQAKLLPARTVKPGKWKITLKRRDAEAA